jgi:hypothetical protein
MLTTSYKNVPSTILIPPWNTPTLYACARSEPLKGSYRSGFDGQLYKKLYYPDNIQIYNACDGMKYSGQTYQKQEIYTDGHIYMPSSDSFCTKGSPVINRYKDSSKFSSLNYNEEDIPEDLKTFHLNSLKSCCN